MDVQPEPTGAFDVHLDNFDGPFDLLLSLISKHKLDVTEVALGQVTDEFIAHIRSQDWDLDQASHFLVVAATLLDLKAARLLPTAEVEDAEDLALLEARDLLFARLLQYRAFKHMAGEFSQRFAAMAGSHPRQVPLEPHLALLLPELIFSTSLHELASLAASAFSEKEEPVVTVEHMHLSRVSVREQSRVVADRIRSAGSLSFRALADGQSREVIVVRFLALLELFRLGAVGFEQAGPLTDLVVRWSGDSRHDYELTDPAAEYAQGAV